LNFSKYFGVDVIGEYNRDIRPSISTNAHKLYILRHCINIVLILQTKPH